ncbi:unnamed protein product [Urochloa decumbens]|uniref:Uncharacterized protein n=1 Tax=Urochloa decumbens TaxID=240449 RepID=A0ABC8YRM9_9POAL
MQCSKKVWRATLLLVVLLVVRLQHVDCRPPPPQLQNDDPCENLGNYSVPCNPAGSPGALAVTIVSSLISAAILLAPINRVKALQPKRSETDTLFWWSIFLGFLGYGLWSIYFMHCYHPHGSNFYILLACTSGAVVYLCFLVSATCKTTTLGDARVGFAIVLPVGIFIVAIFLKFTDRHYIGWFGLGFSVLSHLCRIESTDYHGRFDIWVFIVSFVGAVNSFLWLIHPQLCLSMEYKVNSYITGVLRGGKAFYWCSRSIARFL